MMQFMLYLCHIKKKAGRKDMTDLDIMRRAKMYMEKLAQGIDPISDQEIPEDSVLNNVRLARCFFYMSGILDQVIANGGKVAGSPILPLCRRSCRI